MHKTTSRRRGDKRPSERPPEPPRARPAARADLDWKMRAANDDTTEPDGGEDGR